MPTLEEVQAAVKTISDYLAEQAPANAAPADSDAEAGTTGNEQADTDQTSAAPAAPAESSEPAAPAA